MECESRLGEGGFIDIVDVNERLLVKPAPTNIVVNLWNQLLLDQEFLDGTRHVIYPWNQSQIENRKSSSPRIYPWGRL